MASSGQGGNPLRSPIVTPEALRSKGVGTEALATVATDFFFGAPAGGGTNIAATRHALVLTPRNATVTFDRTIAVTRHALTLTPRNATVSFDRTIAATRHALTLTPRNATVSTGGATTINATRHALTLTPRNASIAFDRNINATRHALTLTPRNATISYSPSITATRHALTLVPRNATVSYGETPEINIPSGPTVYVTLPDVFEGDGDPAQVVSTDFPNRVVGRHRREGYTYPSPEQGAEHALAARALADPLKHQKGLL